MTADWEPRAGYAVSEREITTRKATMASQVFRRPKFTPTTVADPSPQPDEVLLKVRSCGVCGSDTHCYEHDAEGYVLFSGPVRLPCIVGHEYTAEVIEVGSAIRNLRKGDLVAAEGMLYCGVCEACRTGHPNQCPHLDMVGFSAPGAYAEYVTAKERFLWNINGLAEKYGSAKRACDIAALVEPIACSYNGMFISAGGMLPGSHVAVFGCGPIGLGAIALARAAGAATIAAFDTMPERNAVALSMGADFAADPRTTSPAEEIRTLSRGWGADMIVEAAGAALQTMPQIERAFAPGGKMVYLGRTGLRAPVLLDVLVTQAASISGARGHAGGGCFPNILRMMERDRLNVEPMITSRYPFSRAMEAIAKSCDRTDAKVMIEYP